MTPEKKAEFQMFVPEDDGSAMDWLENTLTQDHQAWIDEAVEKIPRKVTQPGNESWSPQVLMYYEGYNQALDDTLTIINSIFKE